MCATARKQANKNKQENRLTNNTGNTTTVEIIYSHGRNNNWCSLTPPEQQRLCQYFYEHDGERKRERERQNEGVRLNLESRMHIFV